MCWDNDFENGTMTVVHATACLNICFRCGRNGAINMYWNDFNSPKARVGGFIYQTKMLQDTRIVKHNRLVHVTAMVASIADTWEAGCTIYEPCHIRCILRRILVLMHPTPQISTNSDLTWILPRKHLPTLMCRLDVLVV